MNKDEYDVLELGFTIPKEFSLDLDSDEPVEPLCDLSDDGTCESCQ